MLTKEGLTPMMEIGVVKNTTTLSMVKTTDWPQKTKSLAFQSKIATSRAWEMQATPLTRRHRPPDTPSGSHTPQQYG